MFYYFTKIKLFIFCLTWMSFSDGSAQKKFSLSQTIHKDSIYYYLKNNTNATIKASAITCTWFHMKGDLVFWPEDKSIPLNISTTTGRFQGNTFTFRRRSDQKLAFSRFINPGDSAIFVRATNYNKQPDTLMCANMQLYYLDSNGEAFNDEVYPNFSQKCPFQRVFVVGDLSNDGIRFGSFANKILHVTNTCSSGLVVVIIHRSTLKPTTAPGIDPQCADGRKWTSFGYPTDEQIFYRFDFTDTSNRTKFVQFLEAINNGYHVFFSTPARVAMDLRDKRLANAMKLIGSNDSIGKTLFSEKMFTGYGQKGAKQGTIFFKREDAKNFVPVIKEFLLLQDQEYSTDYAFAACYEPLTAKILEEQPNKPTSTEILNQSHFSIYPNPSNSLIYIDKTNPKAEDFILTDNVGKVIQTIRIKDFKNELFIGNLIPGCYFLMNGNQTQKFIVTH
jgi:hypothetical protein